MAKTEGEPVLDSDQEEIALSDSELDNVLKSADLTNEAPDEDESNLEQYGVWVKVEPQNLEEEAEQNMSFELSDLDSSSESALTEEEEQLLGELEGDEETDLGDLSGLEDDLEELGKGSAFEEQGGEEELSVEDLDVDLDELSADTGDLEGLPEMGGEDELSLEIEPDSEIEVPLSDSAIVEEHYEDLATVEGVPSTPGQAPRKGSSDILEKIERDLNQIKTEIQSLKNELVGLGKGGPSSGKVDVAPAPSGSEGFFEKGEDEIIALTGDELDNILNTADVTEEVEFPEERVESLEVEELPEPGLEELSEEAEEQIMELGSLDLEEEDTELSLDELEPSGAEEESIEIDIGEKAPEEELSLDEVLPAEELGTLEAEPEEMEGLSPEEPGIDEGEAAEELTLEEPAEVLPAEDLDLEELDELGLDESGMEEIETPEELSLEEPAEELELEELDELGLEEESESAEEPIEELSLGEPAEVLPAEKLELEELDELGLEEEFESAEEPIEELEELSLEEPGIEEAESPEELTLEEIPATEDTGAEEDIPALDELAEGAAETGEAEDLDLTTEELSIPEVESEAGSPQPISEVLPEDLRSEIKSVLSYFDQLLEALPEDKIKEFAQSEYFVRYQRLFKELGLGA